MKHSRIALSALVVALAMSGPAASETLRDALRTAYINNPQIEAQRQIAAQAQEQLAQARGQRRPTLSLSGSAGFESIDNNAPFAFNNGERATASATLDTSLPIYAGGRIDSGIRQAKASIGTANAQLEGVSQDLILQTVTTYVDLLRDIETVKIRQNSVELLSEQVRAANDRFEVGEVTRTDVAQAEARLEGALASLAGAESQLEGSRAVYTFLVGAEAGELAPAPPAPAIPGSFDEALEIALGQSPDIEAARFNERAAAEAVEAAKGALKPTVSVVGRAGYQEAFDENFRTTSVTALAQASVPLFNGGVLKSQVRSARLQRDQARLQSDNTQRQIRAQVAQAWFGAIAAEKAIIASQRQVEAAEIAYAGAQEELAVGVRTTLDVLDQEQQLLEARLNLIRSQRDSYVAIHQLLRAMGVLEVDRLGLDIAAYEPEVYGDKIRRNWLLTEPE